jgi:hypothetical protein
LGDCRETFFLPVILTRRSWSPKDLFATAVTATREVKATQSSVKLGWFGLFVELLGRLSTGSSFSASVPTDSNYLTTSNHFVPHLTRKSLIVNIKLKGVMVTKVRVA